MAAKVLPVEVPRFYWNERDQPTATFRTLEVMLRDNNLRLIDTIADHAALIDSSAKLTSTPSTASSPGNAGEFSYDADYIYICVATDTWKRVAVSTW